MCLSLEVQTKNLYTSGLFSFRLLLSTDPDHSHLVHWFFVHPTSQSIPVHINYVCVRVPIYVRMYIYLHLSHPQLQLRLELKLTFKISNVEIWFFFPTISLFSIETNYSVFIMTLIMTSVSGIFCSGLFPAALNILGVDIQWSGNFM